MPNSPRIHILGLGNLGRLFAHALATSPNPPPITLLFHRPSVLKDWEDADRQIRITAKDLSITSSSSNYSIEVVNSNSPSHSPIPSQEPIQNLVITTKAQNTLRALTPLLPRLTQQSTLLFAQNGLGTIDEVTSALFPNPTTRPSYLAAITSHGVYSTGPFKSVHAGLAEVKVGPVYPRLAPRSSYPSTDDQDNGPEAEQQTLPLLKALTSSPLLTCASVSAPTLKTLQLEKLTINAIINPLTAILGIKNGEILQHNSLRRVTHLLIEECSRILISLPELQSTDSTDSTSTSSSHELPVSEKFSPSRLDVLVTGVAQKTAANTSSMLQDVQAGRETEIEYINGYFVRRARETGVGCALNEKIVEMVKGGVRVGAGEVGVLFEGLGG